MKPSIHKEFLLKKNGRNSVFFFVLLSAIRRCCLNRIQSPLHCEFNCIVIWCTYFMRLISRSSFHIVNDKWPLGCMWVWNWKTKLKVCYSRFQLLFLLAKSKQRKIQLVNNHFFRFTSTVWMTNERNRVIFKWNVFFLLKQNWNRQTVCDAINLRSGFCSIDFYEFFKCTWDTWFNKFQIRSNTAVLSHRHQLIDLLFLICANLFLNRKSCFLWNT